MKIAIILWQFNRMTLNVSYNSSPFYIPNKYYSPPQVTARNHQRTLDIKYIHCKWQKERQHRAEIDLAIRGKLIVYLKLPQLLTARPNRKTLKLHGPTGCHWTQYIICFLFHFNISYFKEYLRPDTFTIP